MITEFQQTEIQNDETFLPKPLHNEKYEKMLEHLETSIILFNREGVVIYSNDAMARLLGLSRQLVIGSTFLQLLFYRQIDREKRKKILEVYRDTIGQQQPSCELRDQNGNEWMITITSDEQMNGDTLVNIKDISNYKKMEQTAYQNDKLAMLGKIAASIAHEIRNPLTSIRGFVQLLRTHLVKLGKDEYAHIILMEIDRINDIIYEFLNASKPSAPHKKVVSIRPLLREVMLLTESECLMKGCKMDLEPSSVQLDVSIDVKQIKQVILNLIKNAMDAIENVGKERIGRITIKIAKEDGYAKVCVTDNGEGIESSKLLHLFDPFFTTKKRGTGIGLSVSSEIVKNHGGFITVESAAGQGTQFNIMLPIA